MFTFSSISPAQYRSAKPSNRSRSRRQNGSRDRPRGFTHSPGRPAMGLSPLANRTLPAFGTTLPINGSTIDARVFKMSIAHSWIATALPTTNVFCGIRSPLQGCSDFPPQSRGVAPGCFGAPLRGFSNPVVHCATDNLPNKVVVREYMTVLPDGKRLAAEIAAARTRLEARR